MEQFIAVVVTALLAGIGNLARQWVKTNLTPARLAAFGDLVNVAVAGAEEVGRVANLTGSEKFEYAENALRAGAKTLGLRLDDATINAYIHALLYSAHAAETADLDLDYDLGADSSAA